jgi:Leucine-rich repeat (LRR) protein
LIDLDLYGNEISELVLPHNLEILSKIEVLNLGYNGILFLPHELTQLRSLRILRLANNFLSVIPRGLCDMSLEEIDVKNNPVQAPPMEQCRQGITFMRAYWSSNPAGSAGPTVASVTDVTECGDVTRPPWTVAGRPSVEPFVCPTGVDSALVDDRGRSDETSKSVRGKVNFRLDQCEAIRFPFKKKLMLDNMHLTNSDIPMKDLCGTPLGNALFKLSLAKNRLGSIPPKLVVSLPLLRSLDLSQCELHQLPEQFNLPKLQRLNLRHNRFTDFPDEVSLREVLAVWSSLLRVLTLCFLFI